jgi:hypothetical protein
MKITEYTKSDDFYRLFFIRKTLEKANFQSNAKNNLNLLNIIFYFYFSVLEVHKEKKRKFDNETITINIWKKNLKYLWDNKQFDEQKKLDVFEFNKDLRSYIFDLVNSDALYDKVFFTSPNLPQHMKKEVGYFYSDLKKVKDMQDLFNLENLIEISKDLTFPQSVDLYYNKI